MERFLVVLALCFCSHISLRTYDVEAPTHGLDVLVYVPLP